MLMRRLAFPLPRLSKSMSFVGGRLRLERRRRSPPAGRSPRVSDNVRLSFPGRCSSSSSSMSGVAGGVKPAYIVRQVKNQKKIKKHTRLVLPNRTPVPSWNQSLVIPWLPINIMTEDRDHILIRVRVHMMHLVAPVEHIRHHLCLREIGNRR